jgi:hypothetical protein
MVLMKKLGVVRDHPENHPDRDHLYQSRKSSQASLSMRAAQLVLRKNLKAKDEGPLTLSGMDCRKTSDNAVGERSGPAP